MSHRSPPALARRPPSDLACTLLNGFSQVFLQRQPWCGLVCLLAIAWGAPQLLGGALLGGFAGWLTAVRRHYSATSIDAGLFGYNAALLGMLLCSRLAWSPLLPLLIIGSAGFSSLLLHSWLAHSRRAGLPAYTAPFVLLAWGLLALIDGLQLPAPAGSAIELGGNLALAVPPAILRGLGQVLFIADPGAGALVLLALGLANWRTALLALGGSTLSLLLALGLDQQQAAWQGLFGLNGALVAIALFQASRQPVRVVLGIVLSTLLQAGMLASGMESPLTAPFILACWALHYLRLPSRLVKLDC